MKLGFSCLKNVLPCIVPTFGNRKVVKMAVTRVLMKLGFSCFRNCKKASKQLAVDGLLTRHGKLVIYNSFIASNFSYCSLVWQFCSTSSTKKLEKVQERALRFIYNDYISCLNDHLKLTNTQPFHVSRLKQMACLVFKIIYKLSPEYIYDIVEIKTSTYNFRAQRQAVKGKSQWLIQPGMD